VDTMCLCDVVVCSSGYDLLCVCVCVVSSSSAQ